MRIDLNSGNYIELNLIDNTRRDIVFVLPGGGYLMTSPREAKPVAKVFQIAGYHTAIYYYRETILMYPKIKIEGYEALRLLQDNPLINRIFLIGFSAGGHLASLLMTNYHELVQGTILAYPVITTNPFYSYKELENRLLGEKTSSAKLNEISIEFLVHDKVSPVFIMHTLDDTVVPVENSILLIEALKKHHVFVESKFYPDGSHGLSLATKEVAFDEIDPVVFAEKYEYMSGWIDLAIHFLERIKK